MASCQNPHQIKYTLIMLSSITHVTPSRDLSRFHDITVAVKCYIRYRSHNFSTKKCDHRPRWLITFRGPYPSHFLANKCFMSRFLYNIRYLPHNFSMKKRYHRPLWQIAFLPKEMLVDSIS